MIVCRPTLSGSIGPVVVGISCAILPGINTTGLLFDHVGECIAGADGATVNTWNDSSAAANNLSGQGGVNNPIKKAAFLNGWSAMQDNGGGSFLLGTSLAISAFTYIAVVHATNLAAARPMMGGASGSMEFRIGTDGKLNVVKTATANMGSGNSVLVTGTWYTVGITYASPNIAFYVNGAADGTPTSAQTFTANNTQTFGSSGGGTSFHGYGAEELLWSSVLSGGDLTTVFDALRTRYAHY